MMLFLEVGNFQTIDINLKFFLMLEVEIKRYKEVENKP